MEQEPKNVSSYINSQLPLIETHLQLTNIVSILFTINPELVQTLVDTTPQEARSTSHFKIVELANKFYADLRALDNEAASAVEEPSNIIQPELFR